MDLADVASDTATSDLCTHEHILVKFLGRRTTGCNNTPTSLINTFIDNAAYLTKLSIIHKVTILSHITSPVLHKWETLELVQVVSRENAISLRRNHVSLSPHTQDS